MKFMKFLVIFWVGFFFNSLAYAQGTVGVISNTIGNVEVSRAGSKIPAKKNLDLFESDVIFTGVDSAVKVQFSDGSNVSLFQNAQLNLVEYKTKKAKSQESSDLNTKSVMDVVKGKIRFLIKPKEGATNDVKFRTPNSVMGIRGTEGIIDIPVQGSKTDIKPTESFLLLSGTAQVSSKMNITKSVILAPNTYTLVKAGQAPENPKTLSNDAVQKINQETPHLGSESQNNQPGVGQSQTSNKQNEENKQGSPSSLSENLQQESSRTESQNQKPSLAGSQNSGSDQERRSVFTPEGEKSGVVVKDQALVNIVQTQAETPPPQIVKYDTSEITKQVDDVLQSISEIINQILQNSVTNSYVNFYVAAPSF